MDVDNMNGIERNNAITNTNLLHDDPTPSLPNSHQTALLISMNNTNSNTSITPNTANTVHQTPAFQAPPITAANTGTTSTNNSLPSSKDVVSNPPKKRIYKPLNTPKKKRIYKAKKQHKSPRRWTKQEHDTFLRGLELHGRDWGAISKMKGIVDRPKPLVRSHAQRHFIKLWKRGEALPLKVQESGKGYTLSGKKLDPKSASVLNVRRKGSTTSKKKYVKKVKKAPPTLLQRARSRQYRRIRRYKRMKAAAERKKRDEINKECTKTFNALCEEEGLDDILKDEENYKDGKELLVHGWDWKRKYKKKGPFVSRLPMKKVRNINGNKVHGAALRRMRNKRNKRKIGISFSYPMDLEGFASDSGAVKHLAPLFIRPRTLQNLTNHDVDHTFFSHFHKIWLMDYHKLKDLKDETKEENTVFTESHFDVFSTYFTKESQQSDIHEIKENKDDIKEPKKKRSDKEEMSDDEDDDLKMNMNNECEAIDVDIDIIGDKECAETENVSIVYHKNEDGIRYDVDSHHVQSVYSSISMPNITPKLVKQRRFHVVYFNFKQKGAIITNRVLKKWGLVDGDLRMRLMEEYDGTFITVRNLSEILQIREGEKIKTGIFMIHFRYHPLIGIQTFKGNMTEVLNESNVVLFVRFQNAEGYVSVKDKAQNRAIRAAQKKGEVLTKMVPKDTVSNSKSADRKHTYQRKKLRKLLRKMLRKSGVLLWDKDGKKAFEVTVNDENKSYTSIKCAVGKQAIHRTNTFPTKKKVYAAVMRSLLSRFDDGWSFIRNKDHDNDECKENKDELMNGMDNINPKKRSECEYEDKNRNSDDEPILKKRKLNTNDDVKSISRSRMRSRSPLQSRSRSRSRDRNSRNNTNPFIGLHQSGIIQNVTISPEDIRASIDAIIWSKEKKEQEEQKQQRIQASIDASIDAIFGPKRNDEQIQQLVPMDNDALFIDNITSCYNDNMFLSQHSNSLPTPVTMSPNIIPQVLTPNDIQNIINRTPLLTDVNQMYNGSYPLNTANQSNPFAFNNSTLNMQPLPLKEFVQSNTNGSNQAFIDLTAISEFKEIETDPQITSDENGNMDNVNGTDNEESNESTEMVEIELKIKSKRRLNVKIELIVGYDVFSKQLSRSQQTLLNTIFQHFAGYLEIGLKEKNDPEHPFYPIYTRDSFDLPLPFTTHKQRIKDREFDELTYYMPTPSQNASYIQWLMGKCRQPHKKTVSRLRYKSRMMFGNTSKISEPDSEQNDNYVDVNDNASDDDEGEYVSLSKDHNVVENIENNKNDNVMMDKTQSVLNGDNCNTKTDVSATQFDGNCNNKQIVEDENEMVVDDKEEKEEDEECALFKPLEFLNSNFSTFQSVVNGDDMNTKTDDAQTKDDGNSNDKQILEFKEITASFKTLDIKGNGANDGDTNESDSEQNDNYVDVNDDESDDDEEVVSLSKDHEVMMDKTQSVLNGGDIEIKTETKQMLQKTDVQLDPDPSDQGINETKEYKEETKAENVEPKKTESNKEEMSDDEDDDLKMNMDNQCEPIDVETDRIGDKESTETDDSHHDNDECKENKDGIKDDDVLMNGMDEVPHDNENDNLKYEEENTESVDKQILNTNDDKQTIRPPHSPSQSQSRSRSTDTGSHQIGNGANDNDTMDKVKLELNCCNDEMKTDVTETKHDGNCNNKPIEKDEDEMIENDKKKNVKRTASYKKWNNKRRRRRFRDKMVWGMKAAYVGATAYNGLFTEQELQHIEAALDKIQLRSQKNAYKKHTSQSTTKRANKTRLLVRTKHFFGARYLWHPSEFRKEGKDKGIGAGLRVDVDDIPAELFNLCERKLVKYGIIPSDWIQGIAFNMYHDGSEGLGPHFDDEERFDRPIITIRLFSDARIAFGTDLYGTTNGTVSIPLPRGCVLLLHKDSYAADGVKHTIRPCDMYAKSAAVILRRFQQKALEAAHRLHEQREGNGFYEIISDVEQDVADDKGEVIKKAKRKPVLYGGQASGAASTYNVIDENEYIRNGFCVADDVIEYCDDRDQPDPLECFYQKETICRNNKAIEVYDLTSDANMRAAANSAMFDVD